MIQQQLQLRQIKRYEKAKQKAQKEYSEAKEVPRGVFQPSKNFNARLKRQNPKQIQQVKNAEVSQLEEIYKRSQSLVQLQFKPKVYEQAQKFSPRKERLSLNYMALAGQKNLQTRIPSNQNINIMKRLKTRRQSINFYQSHPSLSFYPSKIIERKEVTPVKKRRGQLPITKAKPVLVSKMEKIHSLLHTKISFKSLIKSVYLEKQKKLKARQKSLTLTDNFKSSFNLPSLKDSPKSPKQYPQTQKKLKSQNQNLNYNNTVDNGTFFATQTKQIIKPPDPKQVKKTNKHLEDFIGKMSIMRNDMNQREQIVPNKVYFDRERVCQQLTLYSQFGKYKKKQATMRDKTRMALIDNKRKIKRFLQLKNTRIFNKRNTKFRYKKIEESSIDFSKKLDFMRIVNYEM